MAHALSDTGGAAVNYVFDAYGNPVRSSGVQPLGIQATPPDPWGFGAQAGYYGDGGLLLLTHRYYSASAGRFLTRDPLGYGGGINLYSYTQNNPGNGMDPDGTDGYQMDSGGVAGFGTGLEWALRFQNRPGKNGFAKLGKPSSSWPYWDRSFAIDAPDKFRGWHINAEFGPLSKIGVYKGSGHINIPEWIAPIGKVSSLKNLSRGAFALGLALDVYDIATAGPCHRGQAIGSAIGSIVGGIAGAAAGGAVTAGIGAPIGGAIGGMGGSSLGGYVGGLFDPKDCSCGGN